MDYYDRLETRDPAERERDLMARLGSQVAHAKTRSPYFAAALARIDPREVTSRAALAQLPVIRKGELIALQKKQSPFGGLAATPLGQLGRLFSSPGPIYEARGIKVRQCYVTADVGMIAYESEAMEGIRFGTGDLSAILPGASPCGRTNMRIEGWMGRADQSAKVKGMFVQPAQVAEVLKRHPEVRKARLVVDNPNGEDRMTLHCEVPEGSEALKDAIVASLRNVTTLRSDVVFHEPNRLPNDGKLIEDLRRYG